jgi:RimJ/RimL family protein N-acetyltransferase
MTAPWSYPLSPAAAALAERAAAALPVLETDRLRLRPPVLADFAAWAGILGSPRATHIGGPMTEDEAWDEFCRAVAVWLLRGHGLWTVEPRAGGAVLGFVLIGFEPGDAEPELGYLFRETAEGRGYATEAAGAARDHAFGALGMPALVSYVAPGNDRSARLARRLGARREPGLLDGSEVWRHPADGRPDTCRDGCPTQAIRETDEGKTG